MAKLSNATINILQSTYYDDYDETKNYYRILFRPSIAVQARELNQLQSILQNQIARFASHIFKDGAVVTGCGITPRNNTPYVRVVDNFLTNDGTFNSIADIGFDYLLTNGKDSNTAVRAKVLTTKSGFVSNYPNTNRLYMRYVFTGKDGSNNDVSSFANGDTLYIYSANQDTFGTLSNTNIIASINVFTTNSTANIATSNACLVSTTDGIIFQKGFFQTVNSQFLVINDYEPNANGAIVGFETLEAIYTENQDLSLNDNANGSTNYNAPGAHRLKLTPTLTYKYKDTTANNLNFFAVMEFDGNTVVQSSTDQIYSALGDAIAKRTFEESGDYTVSPHIIETTTNANSSIFNYEVSPGISYIKGNRVEIIGTRRITANRANTTQIVQNKAITANYGQYVFCKEVLGAMNFDKLGEVAIYDATQTSITDREAISGAPTGNIVGYANIKTVVWYSGTKGTASAQYYVYLFNIRMNAGKNFATDAKSLYSAGTGGYTAFKGDIVLTNGVATIYDATLTPMVFYTGFDAIKSLTPSGGVNDTSFYYRKTSSSTLNPNGFMSFTLSGGLGSAGKEQLFDTNSADYQIILSSNAYSSNSTGTITMYSTVNSTASNTTATFVNGSSTTFEASLKVGDVIRVSNSVSGSAVLYTVGGIFSNTLMYVTPAATSNSVSNTFQKFYMGGSVLNVTDSMLSVNSTSNTFTVSTGITFDYGSGQTAYAQYRVLKSPSTQAAKTIKRNTLVKINCSTNSANNTGPWCLGLPDVNKINAIYVGTGSYSNATTNRAAWFTLNNGQRSDQYDLATISVLPGYKSNITSSTTLLVDIDHFIADTSSGIGYFSKDSYPVSTDGISSNSTAIALAEIPVFTSKSNGARYDLRNCIDFRPVKAATANSIANTNPANTLITINPASANSNTWNISSYGQYHPEVDSVFMADYEYYLPRYDLVLLGTTGSLSITSGQPDVSPKKPLNISDAATIAEVYVPPFPSLTIREGDTYSRPELTTKITSRSNKRYTMRDIGVLEDRISKLEYYTVLSTLEKAAKDLAIPDSSGNYDRFKNGIFADPFNNHSLGNPSSSEYKISIDAAASVARPDFQNHFIDFQFVNASANAQTSNVSVNGPFIMLPYDYELFAQQKFATNYQICAQSRYSFKGSAMLFPSQDVFKDETAPKLINNTIDLAKPMQDLLSSGFINTKIYGSQSSQSVVNRVDTQQSVTGGTNFITDTTTTTTTVKNFSQLSVQTSNKEYNLGTFVTDVSENPYMRAIDVAFYSQNVKPNTKMHVFFDGINVDQYVAPGTLTVDPKTFTYDSKIKNIVATSASKGTTLVANSSGCVAGIFSIPANTFRVGERRLLICNVDDLVTGANAIYSKTEATFYATNLSVSKATSTLTTINPEIKTSQGSETNTTTTTNHVVYFVPDEPPYDPGASTGTGTGTGDSTGVGTGNDPIAQSFMVTVPQNYAGQFIAKIDLYFKQKDVTNGVTVFLCEMTNGVPDFSKVLGSVHLNSSQVNVSDDASSATTFTFDHPIYVSSATEYAFIVEPDARSPEYLIWTAQAGGFDIPNADNGYKSSQVYENPYDGSLFVSANARTWTELRMEDIKFKLYRARFNTLSGTALFQNENDEYLSVSGVVRAGANNISVGDVIYTANSTANTANTTGAFGIVQYYDEANGKIVLDTATAGFSSAAGKQVHIHRIAPYTNTSLSNTTLVAIANVASIDNYKYHTITPKFATMVPQGADLTFAYKGTDSSYTFDSNWKSLTNEAMNEQFDKERIVMSRTNEYNNLASGVKSTYMKATLTTTNPYVSPVIDMRRKSSYFVENLINNDVTNEQFNYGNALSKYISKTVVLADGQDAEDLQVYLTAFRPINSDIKVYAKLKSVDDPEDFTIKNWTPLVYQSAGDLVYSSQGKTNDYVEYQFGLANGSPITQIFNSNTAVNGTTEYISFTSNLFANNQQVKYYTDAINPNGVLTGLVNNNIYFVKSANSTALQLSASQGGTAVDITASANSSDIGHYLKGYVPTVANTAFLNPDSTPANYTVQYTNNSGGLMQGFKYFAIKIVLLSTDSVNVPRINDLRAIALQK